MKYCQNCGKEIMDNAVICVNCGCKVSTDNNNVTEFTGEKLPASKTSVILGIIGIVGAILFALVGHACSILAIIFGAKDWKNNRKNTGLILGIIGESCAIISSIIGAVIGSSLF